MKTGFICASGFNLVATATRGGKRLIAVVLGAPSSAARAVKAAELLESGFTQNPLAWLTPALGSVDALTPVNADPPNLHDQVCGPHRKRPAMEEEEAAGSENGGVDTPFSALLSSLRAPTLKGAALRSELGPVTPVVVYTGPTRSQAELAKLEAVEPAPHHKKKASAKTADTKPQEKAEENAEDNAGEKRIERKATDGKTTDRKATEKKASIHARTPSSSSALAASPPPELQAKSSADKPKRSHRAVSTTKPGPSSTQ